MNDKETCFCGRPCHYPYRLCERHWRQNVANTSWLEGAYRRGAHTLGGDTERRQEPDDIGDMGGGVGGHATFKP